MEIRWTLVAPYLQGLEASGPNLNPTLFSRDCETVGFQTRDLRLVLRHLIITSAHWQWALTDVTFGFYGPRPGQDYR